MKAVLMSIKPKWCEKIFNGEKTVEVRKSAPKLEPPFKVYVYQTKEKGGAKIINDCLNSIYGGGKVVGEFVCDKVIEYGYDVIACAKFEVNGAYVKEENRYNAGACLSAEKMYEYSNGKPLYGWHITKPKLYDTPKDIKKFRKLCIDDDLPCTICPKCRKDKSGYIQCFNTVNRAPQSWCYVVEE